MKLKELLIISIAGIVISGCAVPPKPTQPSGKKIAINPEWIVKSQHLEEPATDLVDDSKQSSKKAKVRGKK